MKTNTLNTKKSGKKSGKNVFGSSLLRFFEEEELIRKILYIAVEHCVFKIMIEI